MTQKACGAISDFEHLKFIVSLFSVNVTEMAPKLDSINNFNEREVKFCLARVLEIEKTWQHDYMKKWDN